jgi:hypothetical protein
LLYIAPADFADEERPVTTIYLHEDYEEIVLIEGLNHHAILHTLQVDNIEYGIFYVPVDAGFFGHIGLFQAELGQPLPPHCYELKFALKRDFDEGLPAYTQPSDWPDLEALTVAQMRGLGQGLFQSTWMLRRNKEVHGIVAVALDDRPKLGAYYRRLLQKYDGQLGFKVHTVLEGSGYAIF